MLLDKQKQFSFALDCNVHTIITCEFTAKLSCFVKNKKP